MKLTITAPMPKNLAEKLSISHAKKKASPTRPKLPPGLSYHKTPQGDKYRIRIRSIKKLEKLGRVVKDSSGNIVSVHEIDEIYDSKKMAEERNHQLRQNKERIEFIGEVIEATTHITMGELLNVHYDQNYKERPTATQLKSRIDVIKRTPIGNIDHRRMKFLGKIVENNVKNGLPNDTDTFGNANAKDYKQVIEQFVESRLFIDKVKPQTLNNDLTIISTALKNANHYFTEFKDNPIIQPLSHIDKKKLQPVLPPKTDKRLSEKQRIEVERLLIEKSRKDHYHEFFIFLLESGCRLSEVLGIQMNDIDLDKRTIQVITLKRSKQHIRFIGITPKMLPIVKKHMQGKKLTEKLFTNSKHTYQTKLKQMRKHFAEAGIRFHWHKTRHTFASNNASKKNVFELSYAMGITDTQHLSEEYLAIIHSENLAKKKAQAGVMTPEELRDYLGHSNIEETGGTYVHLEPEQVSTADLLHIIKQLQGQVANLTANMKKPESDEEGK